MLATAIARRTTPLNCSDHEIDGSNGSDHPKDDEKRLQDIGCAHVASTFLRRSDA